MRLSTIFKSIFLITLLCGIALVAVSRSGFFWMITGWEVLISAAFLSALFSAPALACALTMERGRLRSLLWTGIAASILSAGGWIGLVWLFPSLPTPLGRMWTNTMAVPTSWSVFCAVIALLMRRRLTNRVGFIVRTITIISISLLAVMIPPMVWYDDLPGRFDVALIKFVSIVATIGAFGLISTMLIASYRRFASDDEEEVIRLQMSATCPRCGLRQLMLTGGDTCERCSLRIKVLVP
ncbi:MAG: hypothetical protein V3T84_12115 [Phycisphaerales bacterium]